MIDTRIDADGIATLTWNVADRPMNVLNPASMGAFDAAVKRVLADAGVKGVVVASSRPEFIAGGDLDAILAIRSAEEAMAITGPMSRTLRAIETGGKPFVAAVNGTALGGGLEVALACHRRLVADDARIRLGMPEVTLGLLPAGGGTQRLPRMIGIAAALPYLVEGRKVAPAEALAAGLVDEVVPAAELLERARAWLLAAGAAAAVKPWDAKGFRLPGGTPQSPGPTAVFFGVAGALLGRTRGLQPAPEAILASVYDGCQVDLDTGLRIEQRQFAHLATLPATKNLIRTLFFAMGEANRLDGRPAGVPKREPKRIGILGAGMMGAGLADVAARAGLEVVLLDVSLDAADAGRAACATRLDADVAKGRLSAGERDAALARLLPTSDFAALAGCGLVVEAVFEDRAVKADVIRRAEAAMDDDAVLASNTSTLSIASLADASSRPSRFVGMHFFSPVEKMPLVEVVRGPASGDAAVAMAMDVAKRLRKTPIVVADGPAFYANRAFGMYAFEAMTMLGEGVDPNLIENAGRLSGMPMPPLALIDEFSIELLWKAMRQAREDRGAAYVEQPQDGVLETMVGTLGRKGRKSGRGFYDHEGPGGRKRLWPGLAEHFPRAATQPGVETVRQRLLFAQSLEAARCVEEGIVGARDADVGSILGWGFPAVLGGAFGHIETVGVPGFVAACDALAQAHGTRYAVPLSLRERAAACG